MQTSGLEALEGLRGVWWAVINRQLSRAAVVKDTDAVSGIFAKSCGKWVEAGAQPVIFLSMTPARVTFWLDTYGNGSAGAFVGSN